MNKKIYCIEEQFPDGKATCINQIELPIKNGWQYENRWPIIYEFENEEEFKSTLSNMLEHNVVISKVYIKEENENYKPLMKIA